MTSVFELLPALQAAAICCSSLSLMCCTLNFAAGMLRAKYAQFSNPEDVQIDPKNFSKRIETDMIDRLNRVSQNHQASIPHFMVLSVLYSLVLGDSPAADKLRDFQIACIIYVASRYLFTAFYLLSLQPYRTLCFAVGQYMLFFVIGRILEVVFEPNLGDNVQYITWVAMIPQSFAVVVTIGSFPAYFTTIFRPVTAKSKVK